MTMSMPRVGNMQARTETTTRRRVGTSLWLHAGWGAGIVDHLAADLRAAFPEMKGFSRSNLMYMRSFAEGWPELGTIVQQTVGQLPWGHNLVLLTKLESREARLAHAEQAITHGWSQRARSAY